MKRHRMAAVDATWLHMDRTVNELVVNAVLWFDEPLTDAVIREAILERLTARYPRFSQRVDDHGSAAWWVSVPDFEPMMHVTREQLPDPGDLATLSRRVSQLVSTPLLRDRPLWHIHFIDNYLGGTALVARMHHCIADGVALFRVLLSLSDEAQDGRLGAPHPPQLPEHPSPGRLARDKVVAVAKIGRALIALLGTPPDRRTSLRTALGTAKTVRWSEPLPLDAIKRAARAADATVNDFVLAALTGAFGRWFAAGHEPARDVRAVLPVNLRALDRTEIELGNRFGLVFLRLPVSIYDGTQRVAEIQRRTTALKRSATAPVTLSILRVAGHAHQRVVRMLIDLFSAKASLVVTNVPGPQQILHLGGSRLAGVTAWPPQTGSLGIGVSIISYAGQLVLGLMSDDRVMPDPNTLLDDLRSELIALGAELSN